MRTIYVQACATCSSCGLVAYAEHGTLNTVEQAKDWARGVEHLDGCVKDPVVEIATAARGTVRRPR